MARLYRGHSASLGTSVDVSEMERSAAEVADLERQEKEAWERFGAAADARLQAEGFAWKGLLEIYGKATKTEALKDVPAVTDFRALLKDGKRQGAEQGGTKATKKKADKPTDKKADDTKPEGQ